jgi:hypothetical protein
MKKSCSIEHPSSSKRLQTRKRDPDRVHSCPVSLLAMIPTNRPITLVFLTFLSPLAPNPAFKKHRKTMHNSSLYM